MKSALYQKTIRYMGVKVWNFAMESLQFQCTVIYSHLNKGLKDFYQIIVPLKLWICACRDGNFVVLKLTIIYLLSLCWTALCGF